MIPEKFGFHLPDIGENQPVDFLKGKELKEVAVRLMDSENTLSVRKMIIAGGGEDEPSSSAALKV